MCAGTSLLFLLNCWVTLRFTQPTVESRLGEAKRNPTQILWLNLLAAKLVRHSIERLTDTN